jgi:hypothetical protein
VAVQVEMRGRMRSLAGLAEVVVAEHLALAVLVILVPSCVRISQ